MAEEKETMTAEEKKAAAAVIKAVKAEAKAAADEIIAAAKAEAEKILAEARENVPSAPVGGPSSIMEVPNETTEYVFYTIPEAENEPEVWAGKWGGRQFLIPRGKEVYIPKPLAEIITTTEKQRKTAIAKQKKLQERATLI